MIKPMVGIWDFEYKALKNEKSHRAKEGRKERGWEMKALLPHQSTILTSCLGSWFLETLLNAKPPAMQ